MKDGIHPEYHNATVTCGGCGASFQVGATVQAINVNVCSVCHPFYTGKARFVDTEGRIDKFKAKFGDYQKKLAKK